MKITCLIIDDEPLARKRLLNLVKDLDTLEVLAECSTGKEAIEKIDALKPGLVFLDIQMKDMSGFDVLEKIEYKPLVIFVSAFDEFAIKAFEFLAFDYLLKPYKKERFLQSVNNAIKHFEEKNPIHKSGIEELLKYVKASVKESGSKIEQHRIPVKTGNSVSFINMADVKYIIASGTYVDIYTPKKTFVHRVTLTKLLEDIHDPDLIRVHRSAIVNINFIEKLIYANFGEITIKMTDGKQLRVSKSYKKEFRIKMGV